MKNNSEMICPNCGTILNPAERKTFFAPDTYTCPECHKTFVLKYNYLLLFVELFILLKILEAIANFIARRLTFISDQEPLIFLIELGLAFLISFIQPRFLLKLKISKLVEQKN